MKDRVSPSARRRSPFTKVCNVYRLARSTGYAAGSKAVAEEPASKRGPPPRIPDQDLLVEIRREIESCLFVEEGHRKVHRKHHGRGLFAGRGQVLRLMRQNGLLAAAKEPADPWKPGLHRHDRHDEAERDV